jgi:hypothetical protein
MAVRVEQLKMAKAKKKDSVHISAEDCKMDGDVGKDVKMMVHGKIESVHDDEYGRSVRVKAHKIEHHKGDKK